MTAEWVPVLISATVGFVSGMLADLLKTSIADRRKMKRIKLAIYIEFAFIYSHITVELETLKKTSPAYFAAVLKVLKTKAYDAAIAQPDLFFRIKEVPYILTLYKALQFMEIPGQPDQQIVLICERFINLFDIYLRDNKLDQEAFKRVASDLFRKSMAKELSQPLLDQIKAGKESTGTVN